MTMVSPVVWLYAMSTMTTRSDSTFVSLVGVRIHQYRLYTASPDAPWWQLWAVPLVLGSILEFTALHVFIDKVRGTALPKCSS